MSWRSSGGLGVTRVRVLTLDANVFVAALKPDESYSEACAAILRKIPGRFVLAEPSIVYQEVCGVLARKAGLDVARRAERFLDSVLHPELVYDCTPSFCKVAYELCHRYGVHAIDALYLKTALDAGAVLVSLDGEDFIYRVRKRNPPIEVYHVSEFPY